MNKEIGLRIRRAIPASSSQVHMASGTRPHPMGCGLSYHLGPINCAAGS